MSDANGASSSAALTITITGGNDAPVAVDDSNGGDAVTESGVRGNTPFAGDPSAAGNVLTNDTDVDTGDTRTVTAVNGSALNVGAPLVGIYGTLTLLADGSWSYALNNADPDTNALAQGQAASDAFTYTVTDANGGSSTAALTIAITGTNDAPVAVADGNGGDAVTESGVDPARRSVGHRQRADQRYRRRHWRQQDCDRGQRFGAECRAPLVGLYGTLTLLADGSWSYALNNADPDTNALAQGQAASDAFTYTVTDANGATSTAALTIAITGANDAPVAVADGNGGDAVTESGVVAGDPSAAGNVLTNDTDVDTGDSKTVTAVNGAAVNVGAAAGRHLRHADAPGRRQLELCAQQRRSRHQCAGAGPGRQRRLHLHRDRRQRWQLDRGAHHRHHRHQRRAGGGGGRQRRRCGDRERVVAGDPSATGNVLTNDTDVDTGDTKTVTAVNGSAPNVGAPLVGTYGTLTLAGQRHLELCAQRRRSRHQCAGAGSGRHRRLQLHRVRRQRRHLVRGADHHHYRRQRCAGGDRGGGQREVTEGVAAGDDGGRHDRLRRRRSHRRPRHIGHAGRGWLSRDL